MKTLTFWVQGKFEERFARFGMNILVGMNWNARIWFEKDDLLKTAGWEFSTMKPKCWGLISRLVGLLYLTTGLCWKKVISQSFSQPGWWAKGRHKVGGYKPWSLRKNPKEFGQVKLREKIVFFFFWGVIFFLKWPLKDDPPNCLEKWLVVLGFVVGKKTWEHENL